MISAISSLLLIRMIFASKQRLTTPYHRLLLGISIGDVFYSMTIASLQSMMPSDMNYAVWNANGNEVGHDDAVVRCTNTVEKERRVVHLSLRQYSCILST